MGARPDAAIDFTLLLQHIVVYDIMMQIFLQRFVVTCAAFGRLHGATIRCNLERLVVYKFFTFVFFTAIFVFFTAIMTDWAACSCQTAYLAKNL